VQIIVEALSKENISFHGEKFNFDDVTVHPRPVQTPTPPIYVTGTSARSFKAAAEKGWGIGVGGPAPYAVFKPAMAEYRKTCAENGTTPVISYIQPMHIDEDENRAQAKARATAEYFYHQIAKPIQRIDQQADADALIAAGYGFYAGDAMNQMLSIAHEQIEEAGLIWAGTPAQITNRIIDFIDQEPVDEYAIQTLPRAPEVGFTFEDQQRVHELFATQVIPALR
jgi:alkanesulfonate monooxygenase SsuD/methylene tetrahydromethanopterin reductase-like flavin-dependent oxidoreductase (luciferase family)